MSISRQESLVAERSRSPSFCTLFYTKANSSLQTAQRNTDSSKEEALEMLRHKEFPSFEEWKRRRANRPFGKDDIFIPDIDPREEKARRKTRDQTLMGMMTEKEQDDFYFYVDYYDRMQEKVSREREVRDKLKEIDQNRSHEESMKEKKHKFQKRLKHVTLQHDAKFVSQVPKSKYYEIIKEEHKNQGKIKSRFDLDTFWESRLKEKGLLSNMEEDDDKNEVFESTSIGATRSILKSGTLDNRSLSGKAFGANSSLDQGSRLEGLSRIDGEEKSELTNISERNEPDRSAPEAYRGIQGKGFHTLNKAGQSKLLDELFPKTSYPSLIAMNMNLDAKRVKTEEELALEAIARQRKKRIALWNTHKAMHQMAVTFSTLTRRILEERPIKEQELEKLNENQDSKLSEIFGDALDLARNVSVIKKSEHGNDFDFMKKYWEQRQMKSISFQKDEPAKTRGAFLETKSSIPAIPPYRQQSKATRPLTTPESEGSIDRKVDTNASLPLLSYYRAESELPIVEAKKPSTLWNNYITGRNTEKSKSELYLSD